MLSNKQFSFYSRLISIIVVGFILVISQTDQKVLVSILGYVAVLSIVRKSKNLFRELI
mgnify:CR=1 FL=1